MARAHGVLVTLLPFDWTSIMTEFKNNFGNRISDDRLPAQSMFESFTEKLADGTLKAEPLSLVVSLFEEEQQDAKKPDHSRQNNLQLDSRLTITTKRQASKVRSPQTKRGFDLSTPFLRTYGCWARCASRAGLSIKTSIGQRSPTSWTPFWTATILTSIKR